MVRNGSRINEIYQSHIRPVKPGVFEGYFRFLVGADGGGRTHTPLRVPDFESSASANSATSATSQRGEALVEDTGGMRAGASGKTDGTD